MLTNWLHAMRPVRLSDLHIHDIEVAELATHCFCDSVFRDVPLDRMIFESPQLPYGSVREAARDNFATTSPNTDGSYPLCSSISRVNADFMRHQTHTDQHYLEDAGETIA